jgi:hypothetical protein
MAGLVLAIHVFAQVKKDVDARDEAGLMLVIVSSSAQPPNGA